MRAHSSFTHPSRVAITSNVGRYASTSSWSVKLSRHWCALLVASGSGKHPVRLTTAVSIFLSSCQPLCELLLTSRELSETVDYIFHRPREGERESGRPTGREIREMRDLALISRVSIHPFSLHSPPYVAGWMRTQTQTMEFTSKIPGGWFIWTEKW